MADQPDGPDGVDEPALPFGTSVVDGSEGIVDLTDETDAERSDAGEPDEDELLSVTDEAEASKEPEADREPQTAETGHQPEGAGAPAEENGEVDDEADFEIEVLDVETEPAVEMAAVPPADEESDVHDEADERESAEEDADTLELEALAGGPSFLDDFSPDDYVTATTVEYQGLAEAIEAADQEETQMSAVAVTMPGLESGVVGFEDVTGEQGALETEKAARSGSDLGLRIVTALILMGMLVGALWAGGGWFVAFVTILGILALGEFYGTMRTAGYQPIALIGFLTLIAMMIAGFRYGPFGIVGWFTVGVVAVLVWYAVVVRRNPLANTSITILGFAWIGVLLSFIAPLAATAFFRQLTLAIVLVVAALDVGSYFAGRTFGRTKMSPILSPNKTYEGLLGGVVLAVAMAVGLTYIDWFAPLDVRGALFLAGVAVALGPFGDLAVSMLKRQIGVKDMGSILPGHGGILDRIDALLFIIPVAYFVFSWLGYFAS